MVLHNFRMRRDIITLRFKILLTKRKLTKRKYDGKREITLSVSSQYHGNLPKV